MKNIAVAALLVGAVWAVTPAGAALQRRAPDKNQQGLCGSEQDPDRIIPWLADMDPVGAAITTGFCAAFLDGLPLLGRVYQDSLTLAPGVTDTDGDGNPNANGARQGEFQILLDGANATDPLTGSFGQNLNVEAMGSVQVISTGASAVVGGAQGGFAHVATRSGGNELEGAVKFFYRSDLFDGAGADDEDVFDDAGRRPKTFQSYTPFFRLGGPFRKDRLWYFAALQYTAGEFVSQTLDEDVTSHTRGWNNFVKLSGATYFHRWSLSVHHDPLERHGLGLGVRIDPDSGYGIEQGGTQTTLNWDYQSPSGVLWELIASHYETEVEVTPETDAAPCPPDSCNRFTEDVYTFTDGLVSGPYYLTLDQERRRQQMRADLAFQPEEAPSHRIRAGIEWRREKLDGEARQDPIRINDISAGGFGGLQGTISFIEAFPPEPAFSSQKDAIGGYIQDVFQLPRLTIQLGIRLDREKVEADGLTFFDPVQELGEYFRLASLGSGRPADQLSVENPPLLLFDLNGDGRDGGHCGVQFQFDRYDNSLVTGFTLNENGTYTVVGDDRDLNGNGVPDYLEADGVDDNFFSFVDGGSSEMACAGGPNRGQSCELTDDCPFSLCAPVRDGIASFDPALVGQQITDPGEYGDVANADSVLFDPTAGFFADGTPVNPNCDRGGDDTVFLYSAFSRHQLDFEDGPVSFPRGQLAGTHRRPERWTLENDNLAPRLAIAWDPAGNNKARVFATWGRYFGSLHLNAISSESVADLRTSVYDAADLDLGSNAHPISTGRISTRTVDRDLKVPFTDELVLGGEYRFADDWTLSLRYVRREGRDQLQDVDRNHYVQDADGDGRPDDDFGRLVSFGGFVTIEPDGLPDLFVRNPLFNQVLHLGNVNSSEFQSYQLEVIRHLSERWQMNASYVYSEAKGEAEAFDSPAGNDPGIPDDENLVLDFDQTHTVKITAIGFLPHAQTLGGTIQWASGLPYSVVTQQFSYDAQANPMLRTHYPEGPRNSVRNEGVWTVDLNYRKHFSFDGVQAGFGIEVFNLLDSDDLYIATVDRGSTLPSDFHRRFGRRWQMGLELHF